MRRLFTLLASGCLVFLLVACSSPSGNTQSQTSTPTTALPTPTPSPTQSVPSGTVLYQSDWSQGLASWGGSAGWTIVNGMPQSDLRANNALTVPYTPVVSNYAIEFRIQIVSVPTNGGFFILKASKTPVKNGYVAGILNLLSSAPHSEFANPQIQIYLDPPDISQEETTARPSDYEPGDIWHTYRVEVNGPQARFLADGFGKGTVTSSQTSELSNGPLQLISSGAVVRLSNVTITAL
jgi:Domain of Unknown Function (DUF1080)